MASSSSCHRVHLTVAVALLGIVLVFADNTTVVDADPGGDFQYQFLAQQNAARASLGLPPLIWDEHVASYARSYAQSRRYDCALVHSHGPYGENIFWGSGSGWTPAQAVGYWLAERSNYDYGSNSCTGGMCGHYTQIVWRNSRRLGCAMVTCYNNLGIFITCNYDPPGNYIGERPY